MQRRQLGSTGLSASSLALGTWGLSGDGYGAVEPAEQDDVIRRALALGLSLFETADVYAHGEMELRLGRLLKGSGSAVVVTKVGTDRGANPPRKRFSEDYIKRAADESCKRLDLPRVIVLLHNPSLQAVSDGAACKALDQLTRSGQLKGWGVSAGDASVAKAALNQGAQVIELAYNVFSQAAVLELEDDFASADTAVLARSVLSHGLLCGHWPPHKEFPYGDHRRERWTADSLRRRVNQLTALRSIIGGDILTMRAAALRFVMASPSITSAVLGPRSILQLDQLVREIGREEPYLSEEKLSKLATRLTDVGASP